MKIKSISLSTLLIAANLASAVEYVDLTPTKDFSQTNAWTDIQYIRNGTNATQSGQYWVDSEGNAVLPSENNNLVIKANTNLSSTGISSGIEWRAEYKDNPLTTINNITYDLSLGGNNTGFYIIEAYDMSLDIKGDFNINLEKKNVTKDWGFATFFINIGGEKRRDPENATTNKRGNTYHIYGDMNVKNNDIVDSDDTISGGYQNGISLSIKASSNVKKNADGSYVYQYVQQNTSFIVDGDLNLIKNELDTASNNTARSQRMTLTTNVKTFTVGGVINWDNNPIVPAGKSEWENYDSWDMKNAIDSTCYAEGETFDSDINIGGLQSRAMLTITEQTNDDKHAVNLNFTNKKGVNTTWEGRFEDASQTKFNVSMDATAEGRQTMIFNYRSKNSKLFTEESKAYIIDKLTISGGEFAFKNCVELIDYLRKGTNTECAIGKLILNGGKFIPLGAGAKVAEAIFENGGILVDTDEMLAYSNQLEVQGALTKEGTDKVNIDFAEFDASDLVDTGDSFYVLSAESRNGFSADANDDFAAINLNGAAANFSWIDNNLMVNFTTAVPEPATVAGIAGLLALAFATYRRRN